MTQKDTAINLVVAPDYLPAHYGSWYLLSAYLQRETKRGLHLNMPVNATEEAELIQSGKMGMVYANPFDAAHLIKEMGYLPLARPKNHFDEMVVAVRADSDYHKIEDLPSGIRVALPPNKDVRHIGLILLEAADLNTDNITLQELEAFPLVANALLRGEAEVGFFMASVYHELSDYARKQMRVLVESNIHDISHFFLLHPKDELNQSLWRKALEGMVGNSEGRKIVEALGLSGGFVEMTQEDADFMIDLMDTLQH